MGAPSGVGGSTVWLGVPQPEVRLASANMRMARMVRMGKGAPGLPRPVARSLPPHLKAGQRSTHCCLAASVPGGGGDDSRANEGPSHQLALALLEAGCRNQMRISLMKLGIFNSWVSFDSGMEPLVPNKVTSGGAAASRIVVGCTAGRPNITRPGWPSCLPRTLQSANYSNKMYMIVIVRSITLSATAEARQDGRRLTTTRVCRATR